MIITCNVVFSYTDMIIACLIQNIYYDLYESLMRPRQYSVME